MAYPFFSLPTTTLHPITADKNASSTVYGGRNCAANPLDSTGMGSRCCIPCPVFDWVYSSQFPALSDGAAWVNVVGFVLCGFLLLSYAVLPATATRRTLLNVFLLVGIMLLELGFIVPLARQPDQCFDPVTPNGMKSSLTCAFSGGLAVFGGMLTVVWVVVRSIFMHLQICWDILPGKMLFVAATVGAWSVAIGLTAAVLAKVGVSFRFGGYCHVNVGSISTYWGWMMGFGAVALLLQLATFAFCAKVYLKAALMGRQKTPSDSIHHKAASSSSTNAGSNSNNKREAWIAVRRLQQVLLLQWRSLAIVGLAIFTIAFVCIVFIVLDNFYTLRIFANTDDLIPWLICILQQHEPDKCLKYTGPLIVPQQTAVATLYIIGFVGVEAFFLLFKFDILKAWFALFKTPFVRSSSNKREFENTPESNANWLEQPPRFKIGRGSMVAIESPRGAETENKVFGELVVGDGENHGHVDSPRVRRPTRHDDSV
jgi:hypothetical protein